MARTLAQVLGLSGCGCGCGWLSAMLWHLGVWHSFHSSPTGLTLLGRPVHLMSFISELWVWRCYYSCSLHSSGLTHRPDPLGSACPFDVFRCRTMGLTVLFCLLSPLPTLLAWRSWVGLSVWYPLSLDHRLDDAILSIFCWDYPSHWFCSLIKCPVVLLDPTF